MKNPPLYGVVLSSSLLLGALATGYFYNLYPCHLCMVQRWIHVGCIVVCLGMLFLHTQTRKASLIISLIFFISALAGFYHFMVEAGLIENYCSATGPSDMDSLMNMPLLSPPCNQPSWYFMGLSMAVWNALMSLLISIVFAFTRGMKK